MRILVADDDPVSCRLLDRLLHKWGYEVIAARSGTEAWEVLQADHAPRIALLDWMMPGLEGLEICRRVRARSSQPYVYIVLLTANDKVGNLVEGLESGADDYLTKPFHPQELRARLRVGLRMLDLESGLVEARENLRFKASHDALTSIWNRGAIIELLERELSRSRRDGSSVGILLADIDHFKRVNDTWGHLVGDEVLRAVTGRLKREVRSYDAVGRYGGEEFLILLPGCDNAKLTAKAEQLVKIVERSSIETSAGPVPVTISIGGIASGDCPHAEVNSLLRAADTALYRAKISGRNRSEIAQASDLDVVSAGIGATALAPETVESPTSSK
ncbi:MAG: diguanylate cyclase response regulator [Acidobacteria bacterium]|nr:MAG: diguanylate cyclase response regulator [Acidobacteriota bacterium]